MYLFEDIFDNIEICELMESDNVSIAILRAKRRRMEDLYPLKKAAEAFVKMKNKKETANYYVDSEGEDPFTRIVLIGKDNIDYKPFSDIKNDEKN